MTDTQMTTDPKPAALALFSGGLDSIISVKWMQKLGYTIHPVFFSTPYLSPQKALHYAGVNDIKLHLRDITHEHLQMMRAPKYGFGKNHNPCIDCHALMFRIAGMMLAEFDAKFIISGEVLGQRPMSQRRDALNGVAKTSTVGDLILRPLCQKLLSDTLPIRQGWVNKDETLALEGRGRSAQLQLATQLGVSEFPSPGGGCLLTDKNYTLRLRDLITHGQDSPNDIALLNWGRHFRLSAKNKLIVGRSEADNTGLQQAAENASILLIRDFQGPLAILTGGDPDPQTLRLAASIVLSYSNKAPESAYVTYQIDKQPAQFILAHKTAPDVLNEYKITL